MSAVQSIKDKWNEFASRKPKTAVALKFSPIYFTLVPMSAGLGWLLDAPNLPLTGIHTLVGACIATLFTSVSIGDAITSDRNDRKQGTYTNTAGQTIEGTNADLELCRNAEADYKVVTHKADITPEAEALALTSLKKRFAPVAERVKVLDAGSNGASADVFQFADVKKVTTITPKNL